MTPDGSGALLIDPGAITHWHPNLPAAGGLFGVAFFVFFARKPSPWEEQRKRNLRKRQRGKSRDAGRCDGS